MLANLFFEGCLQTVATTPDGALPVETTAQQPTSSTQGMLRYNTTDSGFEGYDGTEWGAIGGGGGTVTEQ